MLLVVMITLFPTQHKTNKLAVIASNDKASLEGQLNTLLQDPQLKGAITGVSIRDAKSGNLIFSNFGDTRLRPASNMKLLTAATALEVLGSNHTFSTEIRTDGQLIDNTLHGNLYLVGQGDTTLLKEDLEQFAKQLKAMGIHTITGNVVADDSWYDDERYSQDLNWSDEHNYTGAQVSALTVSPTKDFDAGTVLITVHAGRTPTITVNPQTTYVDIMNNVNSIKQEATKKITILRDHGSNRISVSGQIPLQAKPYEAQIAIWEPTGLALELFCQSLEAQDITYKSFKTAQTPSGTKLLSTKKSIPLSELFIPFMKLSNNGIAEVLVKEMGKVKREDGSWTAGLDVMKTELAHLGLHTESLALRDGSGMSHKNLISANELTQLLFAAQDKEWFSVFKSSLPIAGEADRMVGGTLRNRLKNDNVFAKTGTITGVSTLSGYATAKDGTEILFSIMINNYIDGPVTPIEDAVVEVITNYAY